MRFSRFLLHAVLAGSAGLAGTDAWAQSSADQGPAAGAHFGDEQAARGEKLFGAHCLECHARRDFAGMEFQLKWNGRVVQDLYERIATTMPESNPGGLSRTQYTDIVAYLLKMNNMPAGGRPLVADSTMRAARLVLKGEGK
jgi:mono/diheme cytochrome c family protein